LEGLLLAVTAVIVTFNSAGVIGECLDGIAGANTMSSADAQILSVVVDNASTDGSAEQVRAEGRARLIANRENRGFAAAVNRGAREAPAGDFVLVLNPDARLLTGIDSLVAASAQYGLAAGKLVDRDGRAQTGFTVRRLPTPLTLVFELLGINRLWPSNPVNRRYRELDRDLDQPGIVEQPAGAFMMIRGDVWRELRGLDERFHPVWFEDVDFCLRARDAGYQIAYVPTAVAAHEGGHSVTKVSAGRRVVFWYVSLLRYSGKHFRPSSFRGICLAVVLSSIPRMAAGMIGSRSFSPLISYLKVMQYAGACLFSREHLDRPIPQNP
jgi:N-acetylglucosaminyl-diphospho-decaprenol L-rhamnosyltransferase